MEQLALQEIYPDNLKIGAQLAAVTPGKKPLPADHPLAQVATQMGEPCFEEATERLRELAGDRVRIEFGPRSEDRYGRALFYVYTKAGESVAEKLIREGLGKAWERDGRHRELLMAVEDGAERDGNRGLC